VLAHTSSLSFSFEVEQAGRGRKEGREDGREGGRVHRYVGWVRWKNRRKRRKGKRQRKREEEETRGDYSFI
jgi:hypothetical protein